MGKFLRMLVFFTGIAFMFISCPEGGLDKPEPEPGSAAAPTITVQPESAVYFVDDTTISPLSVQIKSMTEDDKITYQWYSNTTADAKDGNLIPGAKESTFPIPAEKIGIEGTTWYYVVITNTNETKENPTKSTTSRSAAVTVQQAAPDTSTANATVTVDFGTRYQYVRGFGGMDNNWWKNAKITTPAAVETMYNPDKLGYNMMRIMIPTHEEYTDIQDILDEELRNPEYDMSKYYEKVKIVNKYGGYILASPWSPPAPWKSNGSINGGGSLWEKNWVDFADFLRDYCQIMVKNGAPIYAVSLQNEWTFRASYEGCEYTNETNRDWWKKPGIGHFTSSPQPIKGYGNGKEQPYVRTMGGESHNEINRQNMALQDPVSRAAIDIVGRHIYGTTATGAYTLAANPQGVTDPENPNFDVKEVWMTEHNINSGDGGRENDSTWNYVWLFMNDVDYTIRLNNENAFIWWYGQRYYSMIGDAWEGSGTTEGVILPRGYGLSHYAKFAKETGRVGVDISGTLKDGAAIVVGANDSNVNQSNHMSNGGNVPAGSTGTSIKITAYVSFKRDDASAWDDCSEWTRDLFRTDKRITMDDITAISLVIYSPTNAGGQGGFDLGTVKIQLPEGFTIGNAEAMRSTVTAQAKAEPVSIGKDRKTAYINLPRSEIYSVRFTRQR